LRVILSTNVEILCHGEVSFEGKQRQGKSLIGRKSAIQTEKNREVQRSDSSDWITVSEIDCDTVEIFRVASMVATSVPGEMINAADADAEQWSYRSERPSSDQGEGGSLGHPELCCENGSRLAARIVLENHRIFWYLPGRPEESSGKNTRRKSLSEP
jgi:hypothetical protein